jgi:hypothetical protein
MNFWVIHFMQDEKVFYHNVYLKGQSQENVTSFK